MYRIRLFSSAFLLSSVACGSGIRTYETTEPGLGKISVQPERVEAVVCSDASPTQVALTNTGSGTLTIDALFIDGEALRDLTVLPATPVWLVAGETLNIPIAGTGTGTLTIRSDAAGAPELTVPIDRTLDMPPVASWTSDASVVDEAGEWTLTVSDDVDPAASLEVVWASSVDGSQGVVDVSSDGVVSLSAAGLSAGDHEISATIVDACGHSTLIALDSCRQGRVIDPAVDLSTWRLSGDATHDAVAGSIDLTSAVTMQVGSAFFDSREIASDDLTLAFQFTLGEGTHGDGFSVTALNSTQWSSWLGPRGCGLGYGKGSSCGVVDGLPGWSLEIDTHGDAHDPTSDVHVAFTLDGDLDNPIVWARIDDPVATGWHDLQIEVTGGQTVVTLDGQIVLQSFAAAGPMHFPAWIGFTAGTSAVYQIHRIRNVELDRLACYE